MANHQSTLTDAPRCSWRRNITPAAVFALLLLWPTLASAVTLVMKEDGATVRGILVRRYATGIVIDQMGADGKLQRRDIPLFKIDLVLDPIDRERLSALRPDKPQDYRIYAEELAGKKADPDARAMAIRLFLIAATLDRESLGRSSLLGMAALARDELEQRRFQAMVYLLDEKHDRRLLETKSASAVSAPISEPTDGAEARVVQAMRFLRQGKLKEARNLSRREGFKDVLSSHPELLSWEDFNEACSPRCTQCDYGKETCPTCGGEGRNAGARCSTCYGRRTISCRRCSGNYKEPPLPKHLLRSVILLELQLLGESDIARVARSDESTGPPWSKLIRDGRIAPAPALRLETLTEFDPAKNVFRDGKWQTAD